MPMHSEITAAATLDAAIRARKSVRAFRTDPVPRHLLVEILDAARAVPSNFNSQPWRVLVTCGLSCGYADEAAAVNQLNMPREPLEGFTRWLGFSE
jgi:nitroreductase